MGPHFFSAWVFLSGPFNNHRTAGEGKAKNQHLKPQTNFTIVTAVQNNSKSLESTKVKCKLHSWSAN